MSKLWLALCAIVVWQIGSWTFAPASPPKTPQGDGRAFGPNEKYLVEGREKQRQSAITAFDMPWGSRCSGNDRKQFISGIDHYYYHRQRQTESYPESYGKAGADYIATQWSKTDDQRIERLTQEAYSKGYLKPSDFSGVAAKIVAAVVKNERVTGNGCKG
ncbi:hypothetical protein [Bradyrhizobium valentinum]|uniref:Uncharacterized protein n=1 Tax=Bradyrhizobium valentinum TaxID=1518501 RepID=A0A0R3L3V6_9BRAD|nr:hypothetical protein [Bradyrhizobium valentinum]KRR01730.1 hypothetical protein CQ10_19680 [Bradyrhizobium valentinum]KRR02561.1 hypothetical protein CP49_35685 [Bradyrhizobium valentinum]